MKKFHSTVPKYKFKLLVFCIMSFQYDSLIEFAHWNHLKF